MAEKAKMRMLPIITSAGSAREEILEGAGSGVLVPVENPEALADAMDREAREKTVPLFLSEIVVAWVAGNATGARPMLRFINE